MLYLNWKQNNQTFSFTKDGAMAATNTFCVLQVALAIKNSQFTKEGKTNKNTLSTESSVVSSDPVIAYQYLNASEFGRLIMLDLLPYNNEENCATFCIAFYPNKL